MQDTQTAIITGATSGIGKAIAEKLAGEGYRLIITGRRRERLEALKNGLSSRFQVEILPLSFDVRDYKSVVKEVKSIPENYKPIEVLVNNAGLAAGKAPFNEGDVSDWEQMIDTNIKGLLYMTREIVSEMAEYEKGHIINIGSLAGKEVYEDGNVYCATKHAVDALNKGMRMDLVKYGIRVTNVNPGLTETEFSLVRFKGDSAKARKVYEGYEPLRAEDIADAVAFVLSRPKHVNINDLTLTPTAQGHSTLVIHKRD